MAVSARVVSKDLIVTSFSFGHEREHGTGARNVTLATYQILKRACTLYDAPGRSVGNIHKAPVLDEAVLAKTRISIRAICVDSAADEILSCEMMRSATLMGSADAFTPNLSVLLRDKAHASKRITSSPWTADPYLASTIHMFCRGRPSAMRIVPPFTYFVSVQTNISAPSHSLSK